MILTCIYITYSNILTCVQSSKSSLSPSARTQRSSTTPPDKSGSIRAFGTKLSPYTLSAQDRLTSELLRFL